MSDPPATKFSWAAFIAAVFVALICGGLANVAMGFVVFASRPNRYLIPLVLMIPGAGVALVAWRLRWWPDGFGQGLIVGGAIVALVGGLCGFLQY